MMFFFHFELYQLYYFSYFEQISTHISFFKHSTGQWSCHCNWKEKAFLLSLWQKSLNWMNPLEGPSCFFPIFFSPMLDLLFLRCMSFLVVGKQCRCSSPAAPYPWTWRSTFGTLLWTCCWYPGDRSGLPNGLGPRGQEEKGKSSLWLVSELNI